MVSKNRLIRGHKHTHSSTQQKHLTIPPWTTMDHHTPKVPTGKPHPLCHYPNQISLKTKATKTSQLSLSNLATNILPFPHAGKTLQIALAVHVHVGYMYM
jgi:hypothetical protein